MDWWPFPIWHSTSQPSNTTRWPFQVAPATHFSSVGPPVQHQPRAWNDTRHHLPSRVSGSCNNARTPWIVELWEMNRHDCFWWFKSSFQHVQTKKICEPGSHYNMCEHAMNDNSWTQSGHSHPQVPVAGGFLVDTDRWHDTSGGTTRSFRHPNQSTPLTARPSPIYSEVGRHFQVQPAAERPSSARWCWHAVRWTPLQHWPSETCLRCIPRSVKPSGQDPAECPSDPR